MRKSVVEHQHELCLRVCQVHSVAIWFLDVRFHLSSMDSESMAAYPTQRNSIVLYQGINPCHASRIHAVTTTPALCLRVPDEHLTPLSAAYQVVHR